MKKGIVYQSGSGMTSGEVEIARILVFLKTTARGMAWGGLVMICISVFSLGSILMPVGVAEIRYGVSNLKIVRYFRRVQIKEVPNKTEEKVIAVAAVPDLKPTATPVKERPAWQVPDNNYSIFIPKLEAVSRVIENVDPTNEKEYTQALKQGVAEARGLAHPGERGTTYLFAHSVGSRADYARYNAVFYLLDKLVEGDKVEVVYKDKLLKYRVYKREILPAKDIRYLMPQQSEEILVLQTCYPPGTTWKRLMVIAKPEN